MKSSHLCACVRHSSMSQSMIPLRLNSRTLAANQCPNPCTYNIMIFESLAVSWLHMYVFRTFPSQICNLIKGTMIPELENCHQFHPWRLMFFSLCCSLLPLFSLNYCILQKNLAVPKEENQSCTFAFLIYVAECLLSILHFLLQNVEELSANQNIFLWRNTIW